jgi:hypothetical protein
MSMSEAKDTLAQQPGLLYVNSKITNPELSIETFHRWYEDVHIPDIFKSGITSSAFRFVSTKSKAAERPYLALYPVEDVESLHSPEFKSILFTAISCLEMGLSTKVWILNRDIILS